MKHIKPILISFLAIALAGCATTDNVHSDHNDVYADVPSSLVKAYLNEVDEQKKADLADLIKATARGGKSFALFKWLGVEFLPLRFGLASESHDHSFTRAGTAFVRKGLKGLDVEINNPHGTVRKYKIAEETTEVQADAITAFMTPFKSIVSNVTEAWMKGPGSKFFDRSKSDEENLTAMKTAADADPNVSDEVSEDLQKAIESIE